MNFLVIVLTIKRNTDRQHFIKKIMNQQNIDYIFFFGIDYKYTNVECVGKKYFKHFCPQSVMACAASHILLWKYISTLNYDFVIILEDDTCINMNKLQNYLQLINKLSQNSIVFLYSDYCLGWQYKKQLNDDCIIIKNPRINLSMGAYVINPKVAFVLYKYYIYNKIWFHIDVQLSFDTKKIKLSTYVINIKNLIKQHNGHISSMGVKHNSVFLNAINNTTMYRYVTTPIIRIKKVNIDGYTIIIIVFIIYLIIKNSITIVILILIVILIYELIYMN